MRFDYCVRLLTLLLSVFRVLSRVYRTRKENFMSDILCSNAMTLVCCVFLTLSSWCMASAKAAEQIVLDDIEVTLSESFERLGYEGFSMTYKPAGNSLPALVNNYTDSEVDSYVVHSAKAAHQGVQMRVVAAAEEKIITNMQVSSFSNSDSDSVLLKPVVYIVGNLSELGPASGRGDTYPDALIPLSDVQQAMTFAGGARFLLDFSIPSSALAGNYQGYVEIGFSDGPGISIPLEIIVWDFEIPAAHSVAMQLFQLDKRSIAYWYGLDPWDPALTKILTDGAELLVDHRFSLSSVLPFSVEKLINVPVLSEGRDYIQFDRGQTLEKHVAKFEQLGNTFSVNLQVKFDKDSSGVFLRHQWHNRQSGYRLSFGEGVVSVESWTRGDANVSGSDPAPLTLVQTVNSSAEWHDVKFEVNEDMWTLSVDGVTVTEKRDRRMIPAEGGWVTVGSKYSQFRLYGIDWAFVSGKSDQAENSSSYSLWANELAQKSKKSGSESELINTEWLRRWTEFSLKSSSHVNDLKFRLRETADHLAKTYTSVNDLISDNDGYVSLPHDEAYMGPNADKNIQFAKSIKQKLPGLDIFHTFGAMRGAEMSKNTRADILEKFRPYVDIYSLRPNVYFEHEKIFDEIASDGGSVSMYIHDVNIVERDDALLLGRGFFWSLHELGISKVSFWNTSLWFQPEKTGRPARVLESAKDGFSVTKRNPSGLGAGMIFYPGDNGLIPSLRSVAWRDGLEDYEMLKMLESVAAYVGEEKVRSRHAEEAKRLKEQMEIPIKRAKDFRKVPRHWSEILRHSRQMMGALLEANLAIR